MTNNVVLGNNVMTAPNNYGVVCADGSIITMAEFVGVGNANQQQLLLAPGEIVKNSGKFAKPTRIPGKNYCKDEIVIRNADSGKGKGLQNHLSPFYGYHLILCEPNLNFIHPLV